MVEGFLHEGVLHVAGTPDAHTDAGVAFFLSFEGVDSVLDLAVLVVLRFRIVGEAFAQAHDVMGCLDLDILAPVLLHGVVGEAGIEHGEDFWGDVIKRDAEVGHQVWVHLREVIGSEVGQTGCEFHARGSAAYDSDMEKMAFRRFGDEGEFGEFEEVEDSAADTTGVVDVFEEEGVFFDAGRVEGLGVAAYGYDELVVGDGEGWNLSRSCAADGACASHLKDGFASVFAGPSALFFLSISAWPTHHGCADILIENTRFDGDGLVGEIDVVGPSLEEMDGRVLFAY